MRVRAQGMSATQAVRAGLVLGFFVGLGDAIAILIENPNSFTGGRSHAAFMGASVAMHLVLGAIAGGILAVTGIARRISAKTFIATGFAAALFLWVSIRVHVRWFFGEPLTTTKSLWAYAAVLIASIILSTLLVRSLRRPIERAVSLPLVLFAAVGLAALLPIVLPRNSQEVAAVPPTPITDPPTSILLITLDTTRADHLSCYGYPRGTTPAIDRLARRGLLFENAYTPIPLTNPSHVSMFTSSDPRWHGVINNGMPYRGAQQTFVETFAESGYRCAAFVSGIPMKAGLSGLERGFEVYDDSFSVLDRLHPMVTSLAAVRAAHRIVPTQFVERPARATVRAAIQWMRSTPGLRVVWVHLYDPHSPYDAPAAVRSRFEKESDAWTAHEHPVTKWPIADYDAELREMDLHLEDLVREFLDADSLSGDSTEARLIIVAADHGEGLEQHGQLTHGQLLFEEDLRVPYLVVKSQTSESAAMDRFPPNSIERDMTSISSIRRYLDGQMGAVGQMEGEAPASLSDVGRGRAPYQERSTGHIAFTFEPEGRETKAAFIERPPRMSADEPWVGRKMIVNLSTGEETAFDLAKDPGESDLIDASGLEWNDIRWRLTDLDTLTAAKIDPEVARQLKSLGYIH
jgi:hypothetical protein